MSHTHLFIMMHPAANSLGKPTLMFGRIDGRSYFQRMVARLLRCRKVDAISLSLPEGTELPEDAAESDLGGIEWFVGPGYGVMERLVARALDVGAETTVRMNGDAAWPLPSSIDELIESHTSRHADITLGDSFPGCIGVDVLSSRALRDAKRLQEQGLEFRNTRDLIARLPGRLVLHPGHGQSAGRFGGMDRLFLVDENGRRLLERMIRLEETGNVEAPHDVARERLRFERERAIGLVRRHRASPPTPTILFVNNVARMGGAEHSLLLLVTELRRRGRMRPVVALFEDGELADRLRQERLPVEIVAPPNSFDNRSLMSAELDREIGAIIQRYEVDLIHSNSITANAQMARTALATGLPSISHVRDSVKDMERLREFSLHLPARLIAVSQFIADSLEVASAGAMQREVDIIPIHNGLDFRTFDQDLQTPGNLRAELGLPDSAFLIGSISQLNWWKGQDVLIRSVAPLLARNQSLHLVIVGSATVNPTQMAFVHDLHRMADETGFAARIHFTGYRPKPAPILRQLDLFVHLPTADDPFPRVLIEAMAAGKAIVASRSGGIVEALAGGECGELVPMGDTAATTTALGRLIEDAPRRRLLGTRANAEARRSFTIEAHAARIESVYRTLLA